LVAAVLLKVAEEAKALATAIMAISHTVISLLITAAVAKAILRQITAAVSAEVAKVMVVAVREVATAGVDKAVNAVAAVKGFSVRGYSRGRSDERPFLDFDFSHTAFCAMMSA
jgi:hypothetical protein